MIRAAYSRGTPAFKSCLASVERNNHWSIRCWCGHAGLIPVKAFIEKFGPDITADQAVTKTRCTKCGASVRVGSQIVYVGNSEFAMSGSRTAQDSEESADTNLE